MLIFGDSKTLYILSKNEKKRKTVNTVKSFFDIRKYKVKAWI